MAYRCLLNQILMSCLPKLRQIFARMRFRQESVPQTNKFDCRPSDTSYGSFISTEEGNARFPFGFERFFLLVSLCVYRLVT